MLIGETTTNKTSFRDNPENIHFDFVCESFLTTPNWCRNLKSQGLLGCTITPGTVL